ncbi:hypothetical protein [Streptomyces sp. NPDC059979]|uniref:hypothetical protein n=1 Tax=Streptomyces sp. NPDC059979 TaxID=3347021 RepID=UPI0036CD4AA7
MWMWRSVPWDGRARGRPEEACDSDISGIGAFLGLDVGKGEHHAILDGEAYQVVITP